MTLIVQPSGSRCSCLFQVIERITNLAKEKLLQISEQLHLHIHDENTKEQFLNCKDEKDPGASLKKDSGVLGYLIAQRVQCKLQALISDWEKENKMFASLQKEVKEQEEAFLSNIARRLLRIDLDLTRGSNENLSDLGK